MGKSIRFPSLNRGHEIGYILHSSTFAYDMRDEPLRLIAPWAGVYQTYGDGMVQHSPDLCCPVESMGDFLASLTTFCLDPRNADALDVAADHWKSIDTYNERSKSSTIHKARQVRFKAGKTRYVRVHHLDISSSPNKAYDRRWNQIVEWMDGSVGATFGVLHMGCGGVYGLERYHVLNRIAQVFHDEDGSLHGDPDDHFDRFKGQQLDRAFGAFESLMIAQHHRRLVEPLLDSYGQATTRDAARAAQTA